MALSEDITQRKDGSSVWIRNNVSLVPGTERVPRSNWALVTELLQGKRRQFQMESLGYKYRSLWDHPVTPITVSNR